MNRATAFDFASDKAGTAVDIQVLLGISCIGVCGAPECGAKGEEEEARKEG